MEYTVVVNGKPEGPYTLAQLKSLAIKPGTFVRTKEMDDYKEAHEVPELRALLGFRYQETAPQYFASFDQRFLASAIDYFMLMICYVLVMGIFYVFKDNKLVIIGAAIGLLFLIPLAKLIYGSFAEASAKQATIGKRLLDIKVTDLLGNRISLSVSFTRNFAKIISTIPLCFGYLYSFLNKKQQCLHDVLANTLVTKQRLI